MISLPASVRIYLATEPIDMRKNIDGLAGLVQSRWKVNPYLGHLFVFVGRRRDRVKILYFDHGGFILHYKRLECGHFRLPEIPPDVTSVSLEATDLNMLLRGIDFSRVRRPVPWTPRCEMMGTPPPHFGLDSRSRS
jgi:transposase